VPEPLVEFDQVEKDYVSGPTVVRALREITLSIDAGELVAIVGTSGSGKSTMMNIIGCLDRPTRGAYRLGGIDVGKRSNDARAIVRNRLIGFIFQGFNLLARTTALENVELPLVYRGVGARERRRRALFALEFADGDSPSLRRLRGHDLLATILPCIPRMLVDDPLLQARELAQLRTLSDIVPVYALSRPRQLSGLRAAGDLLENLMEVRDADR